MGYLTGPDHPRDAVLDEVWRECNKADEKFGPQLSLPDGTTEDWTEQAAVAKRLTDLSTRAGKLTWQMILSEEFLAACAEPDVVALRVELVQVAAVAVRWVGAIDKRLAATKHRYGDDSHCARCGAYGVDEDNTPCLAATKEPAHDEACPRPGSGGVHTDLDGDDDTCIYCGSKAK